jgi:iron complex transport system permease protein
MRLRWGALIVTFCVVLMLAATLGAPVPLSDLWSSNTEAAQTARRIFLWTDDGWGLRPVRLLAGLLVGASLATSGASLQAVFRNPLAEPYLLGISAGGALGATLATALNLPAWHGFEAATILAFVGALGAAGLIYQLGQRLATRGIALHSPDRAVLLLTGVALSAFLAALMSLIVTLSNRIDIAQQVMFWLLGSLTRATMPENLVAALCLGAGMIVLSCSARDLNAMQIGDEEAAGLGVDIARLHWRLLIVAALMSAAAVSLAGLIGFVGLLGPHIVRLIFGNDARSLMPAAAIGGATLLLGCDALAHSVLPMLEIPVGIITALLGVPLFLLLALRQR